MCRQRCLLSIVLIHVKMVIITVKVVVNVRVVFLKIGEIDTVKETYTAEVFIQASWREPLFDGKTDTVRTSR